MFDASPNCHRHRPIWYANLLWPSWSCSYSWLVLSMPGSVWRVPTIIVFELNNHYSNGLFSIFAVSSHTVLPFFLFRDLVPCARSINPHRTVFLLRGEINSANWVAWPTMAPSVYQYLLSCTLSVLNYRSFDFFNLKFDHFSYSKKL